MLVLSRKYNEKIMVGDHIVITVVDIRGDRVRLGIEAPTGVRIMRSELISSPKKQEQASEYADNGVDAEESASPLPGSGGRV